MVLYFIHGAKSWHLLKLFICFYFNIFSQQSHEIDYYYFHFLDEQTDAQGSHPGNKQQGLDLSPNLIPIETPFHYRDTQHPSSVTHLMFHPCDRELLASRHPVLLFPCVPSLVTGRKGVCSSLSAD